MRSVYLVVMMCGTAAAQPGADSPVYPAPQPYPQPQPVYPAPQPYAQPAPQPAPGGARTTFVSTTEKRWDVRVDDGAVCTTPCSIYVEPHRFVTLHSHDIRPQKLRVGYLPPGEHVVNAKPRSDGAFATAITFTSLGGAAAVTGITLAAVGCNTDNDAMCRAGLITGLAGGVALAVFIPMIGRALPRATIGWARTQPYVNGHTTGLVGSF
jgi:hypothetical protein